MPLTNTTGRVLQKSYEETPSTWESFAAVRNAADFNPQQSIRPSAIEAAEQLAPGGEIKHGTLSESTLDWQIDTFAKMLTVDRRSIINDSLGLLQEVSPALGRAARRALNDLAWRTITESTTHFTVGNSNLFSLDLTIENLGTAIAAMRSQRDAQGFDIDIRPKVLVVGPGLEQTAREVINSTEIRKAAAAGESYGTGNPLSSAVEIVVESRIANTDRFAGADANSWYLFAAPSDTPIIVGFLRGMRTPKVESSDTDFNTLGRQFRVYHDFGVAMGDPKAGAKSDGAT